MAKEGAIPRYDPAIHKNSLEYVNAGGESEVDLRINLALGGLFTPLVEELHRVTVVESPGGIVFPRQEFGHEPTLFNINSRALMVLDLPKDIEIASAEKYWICLGSGVANAPFPVGRFGDRLSYSMAQASRRIIAVAEDHLSQPSNKVNENHSEVIRHGTHYADPISTIADSVTSTGQAFLLLANSQIVPGYESDPVALFRGVIDSKALNSLARHLVLSYLAELTALGVSFKRALDPITLRLDGALKKELMAIQEKRRDNRANLLNAEMLRLASPETGLGCPVAVENTPTLRADGSRDIIKSSGVNLLAEVFVKYLDYYWTQNAGRFVEPAAI